MKIGAFAYIFFSGANVPFSIIFSKLFKCKIYVFEKLRNFELFIENDVIVYI